VHDKRDKQAVKGVPASAFFDSLVGQHDHKLSRSAVGSAVFSGYEKNIDLT
jgi:hypothetical protein